MCGVWNAVRDFITFFTKYKTYILVLCHNTFVFYHNTFLLKNKTFF